MNRNYTVENLISIIHNCDTLDEAKLLLLKSGEYFYYSQVFYELILKEKNFTSAVKLYEEYINNTTENIRERYVLLKTLLMLCEEEDAAKRIFEKLENSNRNLSVDVYDLFIRTLHSPEEINYYYEDFKRKCIVLDEKIMNHIREKLKGSEYYEKIEYERYLLKSISHRAKGITSKEEVFLNLKSFEENEIELTPYNIGIFIQYISDCEHIQYVFQFMDEKHIEYDENIFMATIRRIKNRINKYVNLLEEIQEKLTLESLLNLGKIELYYNTYREENIRIQEKRIEEKKLIKENLKEESDIYKQQFYIGMLIAFDIDSQDNMFLYKNLTTKEIERLKQEEDKEFYALEIAKLKGILEALEVLFNIWEEEKNLPVKYIIYAGEKVNIKRIKAEYYKKYYLSNTNDLNLDINTFTIIEDINKFKEVLLNLDYHNNDVRVLLYGKQSDKNKFLTLLGDEELPHILDNFIQGKVIINKYMNDGNNKYEINELKYYNAIRFIELIKNYSQEELNLNKLRNHKLANFYFPILKGIISKSIVKENQKKESICAVLNYKDDLIMKKDINTIMDLYAQFNILPLLSKYSHRAIEKIKLDLLSLEENNFFNRIESLKDIIEKTNSNYFNQDDILQEDLLDFVIDSGKDEESLRKINYNSIRFSYKNEVDILEEVNELSKSVKRI